MAYFAVTYVYATDVDLDAVRPDHRRFLRTLADAGDLVASGPLSGDRPSALLLFKADSSDAVSQLLAEDPFQRAHFVTDTTIAEWDPVIGVFAQA